MGRTTTPKHRIEILDQSGYSWATSFQFRATDATLKSWVTEFNNALNEGVNKHLGEESRIVAARIVSQKGANLGQVVCEIRL